VSDPREDGLARIEANLDYHFRDRSLLEEALRHSSFTHEKSLGKTDEESRADEATSRNNERLEFLGDAVLGLVVAHALFRSQPSWREGDLSRARHALVDGRSLEKLARSLDLGSMIRLGRTERQSDGHDKASILENAMEAVIGAIYLDGGIVAAADFVERVFGDALAAGASPVRQDPKSELQERVMAAEGEFPNYRLVSDSEIEGDDARFIVEVRLRDRALARGVGRTKRAGERVAATDALEAWCADHPAGKDTE
jgi:ribonuclease-3